MKNIVKPLILLLAIVLLNACTREEAADAYGNFEDDAVVVSAENAGKLINCRIEEGKQFKINDLVAIIDTIPFHLKKQVLLAGMQTIESKADNVEAQRSVLEEQLDNLKVNQKRIRKMYKDGAATKKQLDDINAQVSVTNKKSTTSGYSEIRCLPKNRVLKHK
jgi:HlyD family secretion protein